MATPNVTLLRIFDDDDRIHLVNILAGRVEFREGARARRVFLQLAGIDKLLPDFDFDGGPQTVAGDLVPRLESLPPLPERPDFYPLGKLLHHLLHLPDLAEGQARVCARLIVHYRLVRTQEYVEHLCKQYALPEEPLPESGRQQENISSGLAARRREGDSTKTLHTYRLDHDSILRQFDLDRQMEEIAPHLRQLPRGGLVAFAVAGDHALVADYLVPRILRDVHDRLGYNLVPQNVYLHTSDLGEIELSFDGIEMGVRLRGQPAHGIDYLLTLASEKNTHRLIVVWNHSLPSVQMESYASRFVTDGSSELVVSLRRQGLLYAFLWISLQPHDFSGRGPLCCLSPFETLDPDFVLRWFRTKLKDVGVDSTDIDRAVGRLANRLQANHGVPQFVFHDMKMIIDDLNEGRV